MVNDPIKYKDPLETIIKVLSSLREAKNNAFKHSLENSVTNNQSPTNIENLK